MNRKLHNSLTALLSSGAVLATLLLVSSSAASLSTEAAELSALRHAEPAAENAEASARAVKRAVHQSIRIPFFSFSPRS